MNLRITALFFLLLTPFSFAVAEHEPVCNNGWCTLDPNANPNYLRLQYRVPGAECGDLDKAVIMLHGSLAYHTDDLLSGSHNLINNPDLQPLFNYLTEQCVLVVLPNSSLHVPQLTLNNGLLGQTSIVGPLLRWDTDNTALTGDKQKLINLITDLRSFYDIPEVVLMGGSSGGVMAHQVASDPAARAMLSGLVLAEAVSANQLKYLDRAFLSESLQYLFLLETFAIADGYVSGFEPSIDEECENNSIHYLPYYQDERYIVPSVFAVEYGHYLDEFRDVNFNFHDLGVPVLTVFSIQDSLIPCALKMKFAHQLFIRSNIRGSGSFAENSVNIAQVGGDHGQHVWDIMTSGENQVNDVHSNSLNWVPIGESGIPTKSALKLFIESVLFD